MSDPRNSPNWRWFRTEAIIRDDYQCQDCGAHGGRKGDAKLHAHHETPVADGGETSLENLVTLCEDCHHERHHGTTNSRNNSAGRGILTEGERGYLRGEKSDQRKYEARSRVKTRINEQVAEDVELLAEHHPDLLDELRAVVCEE